jgi:translation elongation factor EF-G
MSSTAGSKVAHECRPTPDNYTPLTFGGGALATDRIRNVVLVGHSGAGKTVLAEALLHAAGVTTRMGRIEDGNTVTDFEPEEISRRSSVS